MRHRLAILFTLILSAVLRLYGLNNLSPPGLEHDEVANWLIDRAILAGDHAIYFTAAYGHEAGFHYVQAAFVGLLGDHALALRLPAAFAGLLLVAVCYALTRRLFGKEVALIAAVLLGVLFWPIFYSRLGLRAITLPVLSGLSAYFWWQAWGDGSGRAGEWASERVRRLSPTRSLFWAGILAGLSLHTYMAARVVPIFYGLFVVYLALFHWSRLKERWRGLLLFALVYAVIAAPLLIYLQNNPSAEFRITEIDAPLRALLDGNWRPALRNSLKILGMFGFSGDPLWRQNVAGRPVFEPILAAVFYAGVLLCLWRWRDGRYAFVLLWLGTATIPSIVTVDAPSSIRIINILPLLTVPLALVIHNLRRFSTVSPRLSTALGQIAFTSLLLFYVGWTAQALFRTWPQNEEVQFVWQAALTNAADFLDASTDDGPVAIGGWTPTTLDAPTMALTLRRDDLPLSFFDPTNSLIVPTADSGQTIRLIHPTILEMALIWQEKLAAWGAAVQTADGFTQYTLTAMPAIQPQFSHLVHFDDEMLFLGYDLLSPCEPSATMRCSLVTYWQVTAVATGPRRIFVHVLPEASAIKNDYYALDTADSRWQPHWHPGDYILIHHTLTLAETTADLPQLRLGVFNPNTCSPCQNLPTSDRTEFIQFQLGN